MSMLQLPREVEIALAILVLVAESEGGRARTTEVAIGIGVTRMHAAQIVNTLSKAGLLDAIRGRGGGLKLARPASRLSLGDVIEAMNPAMFREERRGPPTPITSILGEISRFAAVEISNLYGSYTIWDLVRARSAPSGHGIGYLDHMCGRLDCPNAKALANIQINPPS